jgi:hypothetical protein
VICQQNRHHHGLWQPNRMTVTKTNSRQRRCLELSGAWGLRFTARTLLEGGLRTTVAWNRENIARPVHGAALDSSFWRAVLLSL